MRIGLNIGLRDDPAQHHEDLLAKVKEAETRGLSSAWWPQPSPGDGIPPWDALTSIAVTGSHVPRIELGTAVVISRLQHPLVLAYRALTIQAVVGNRLTLGVGTGHQRTLERVYGIPSSDSSEHLRRYLEILIPALHGEVAIRDDASRAVGAAAVPGTDAPPVLLAAHGESSLKLAGAMTDGVITAWAGRRVFAEHVVPGVKAAAAAAGRPDPRIVALLPVCVTRDVDAAATILSHRYRDVLDRPAYRQTLQQGDVRRMSDVMPIGNEHSVARQLRDLAAAGVTDLVALPEGSRDDRRRTISLLVEISHL